MTLQGLIKAGFKATQTRGGRVLTPVVAGAVVGVSMWAANAWASKVEEERCHCSYLVVKVTVSAGKTELDCRHDHEDEDNTYFWECNCEKYKGKDCDKSRTTRAFKDGCVFTLKSFPGQKCAKTDL